MAACLHLSMAIFEIFQLNWITLLVPGARPLLDRLERILTYTNTPEMFDFRRLFGVSYCITHSQWLLFHNLLRIHD